MCTSWNPYVIQAAKQTGMTAREVMSSARPAVITDEEAQKRGYASAAEYEQALHDFLNGM